jgi:hypothetical protein
MRHDAGDECPATRTMAIVIAVPTTGASTVMGSDFSFQRCRRQCVCSAFAKAQCPARSKDVISDSWAR